MANVIKLKRGSGSDPSASDLAIGELAIRTDTGKIFLKTDGGSVTSFSAGGLSDGDKGDITVSNAGTTWTIDAGAIDNANISSSAAIAYSKLANISANRVLGRTNAGAVEATQVHTGMIADNAITNAKIDSSAAIAGSKISPDFGSQNIVTTGTLGSGDITISSSKPRIDLVDTGHNSDFYFINDDGTFAIKDSTNDAGRLVIASNGQTTIYGNCDFAAGIDVTGNITVTGTVDGIDIAALNAAHSSISTSNGSILDGVVAITQSAGDNSTKVATTAYTDTAISNLVDSSPSALNTLNELAAALGDDANFSTTVTNSIATKLPLAGGTLTGDTTLANTKKVIFNHSSGAGAYIKHQSGHFEIISSVGNTYFASAGTLYLRTNGSTNALTLDSSQNATFAGEVTAKRLTLSDDGASSPIFMLKTDDNSPWGFTIKNDTYSTSADVGLKAYQNNDGAFNVRLQGNSEYNSFYLLQHNGSSERQILVFNTSGNATFSGSVTATGGFSGSGASLTNVNATTLDSIDSGSFLRSDAADTASGDITFSDSGQYPVVIGSASGMNDGRLLLRGSSNPYIRFREGNTDKAYIQWHSDGYLQLRNAEDGSGIRIKDDLRFSQNDFGSDYKIWHAGNDGAGSGLDADLWDGNQFSSYLNQGVLSTSSPTFTNLYIDAWIRNNDAGEGLFNQSTTCHFYSAGANYWHINSASGQTNGGLILYSAYNGTHGGSTGRKGYLYWDANGFGLLHNGGGWALKTTSTATTLYGTLTHNGSTIWHAGNDGAGSGLDADTVDGYQTVTGNGNNKIPVTDSSGYLLIDDWIRVGNGQGIYASNGQHLYAGANDSSTSWILQSDHSTDTGIGMRTSDGTIRGYAYANSTMVGLLNGNGSWVFRVTNGNSSNGLQTGAGNLIFHQQNDGSGSGLDADTVDGLQASSFLRADASDSFSGELISTARSNGVFGTYDSYKTDHIWSMGTSYKNHSSGTNFGNLYGLAYKHTNNATGGSMGGSHQMVWCGNGEPKGAIGYSCVWHRDAMKVGTSYHTVWHAGNDGSGSGLDADTCDGQHLGTSDSPTFSNIYCNAWLRNNDSGEGLYNTSTAQHWYSDNASYMNLDGNGSSVGIRFRDNHASSIRGYIYGNNSNQIGFLDQNGYWRLYINGSSNVVCVNHFIPSAADSYDLGTTNNRWRNLYVQDMHFSNEGKTNSVDGTWGDWTLQEGEENIFMLNNRTGKKYRMALQEVT